MTFIKLFSFYSKRSFSLDITDERYELDKFTKKISNFHFIVRSVIFEAKTDHMGFLHKNTSLHHIHFIILPYIAFKKCYTLHLKWVNDVKCKVEHWDSLKILFQIENKLIIFQSIKADIHNCIFTILWQIITKIVKLTITSIVFSLYSR